MQRVTPSMVISTVALFVALGGTGIAATNALIGSKQIVDHSIRLVDLNATAVNALRGQRGPAGANGGPGPQGPAGPQGATGAAGPVGPPGANGANGANGTNGTFDPNKIQYITAPDLAVAPGTTGSSNASCPAGTTAISGGFFSSVARIGFSETFGRTFHGISVSNDSGITVNIHATVVSAA